MKSVVLLVVLELLTAFSVCGAETRQQQKNRVAKQLSTAKGGARVDLLLQLSSQHYDSINIAYSLIQQAVSEASRIHDPAYIAKTLTALASLKLSDNTPPDSAAKLLAKAEKAYRQSGKTLFDPELYYQQARYFYKIKNYVQANNACKRAVETALPLRQSLVLAQTYLLQARIARQSGEINAFVELLNKAEKEFRQCDDKGAAGRALIGIGLMFNDAGMGDIGQKVLVRATRLCEQTSDSLFMAYLYCNTANAYKSSDINSTVNILHKSILIFKRLKNDKGLGYAQNMLGMYYAGQNQSKKAIYWFNLTINSKIKSTDWQGACFAACNLADVYISEKKYDLILASLQQSEIYMNKANDKLSAIVYYDTRAKFENSDKNYSDALTHYNQSLQLSLELGDANFYLSNLKAISELYQSIGNAEKAFEYLKKYSDTGDSIKNATQPIKQEELQHELNSEQLIEQAVTLKNNQPDHNPQAWLIVVTLAVTFALIALSTKYFGRNNLRAVAPASLPSYSETGIETLSDDEKTVKLVLSNEVQQLLWTGLLDAMENQKCYLQPDLTLHDLAIQLDTNTLYVSKIINDRTGYNFSSYINQYRILEACKLLLSDSQQILSIEGIAHSSGFNSKSAFNAAFRKLQKMTPTEFIEKHKTGL